MSSSACRHLLQAIWLTYGPLLPYLIGAYHKAVLGNRVFQHNMEN